MKNYHQFISNGLLLGLLIIGQTTLVAHEALHEIDTDEIICLVCLNSPVIDGASPPSGIITDYNRLPETVIQNRSAPVIPQEFPATANPRAPPRYS